MYQCPRGIPEGDRTRYHILILASQKPFQEPVVEQWEGRRLDKMRPQWAVPLRPRACSSLLGPAFLGGQHLGRGCVLQAPALAHALPSARNASPLACFLVGSYSSPTAWLGLGSLGPAGWLTRINHLGKTGIFREQGETQRTSPEKLRVSNHCLSLCLIF